MTKIDKADRRYPILLKSGEPLLQMWMGNFFEPFFSDAEAVHEGIRDIRKLGFNVVNTDSKATANFFARANGEPADPYVAMQESMRKWIHEEGMQHDELAIYSNGENLYPSITDSPPVRGEEPVTFDGQPMCTYKFWSEETQQVMLDHVRNLMHMYGEGHAEFAGDGPRKPVQTMFDPIVKPSFDEDGRQRYLAWLESRYQGNIQLLNERYHITAESFDSLEPEQYWYRPEDVNWILCAWPSAEDFANRTPDVFKWVDNQTWLAEELVCFFKTMNPKYRDLDPSLFLQPSLQQWGMFFNPLDPNETEEVLKPLVRGWCSGLRALDPYRVRPHVDGVIYISSPLNPEGTADAYALSAEFGIARAIHGFEPFITGLYYGRHVCGDIYDVVSPAEAMATLVANGGCGVHAYGYSGLDDGGVMFKLDDMFRASVKTGNEWAKQVIPQLTEHREREVAILFPLAMHLYEPAILPDGARHRMDLLGWYRQFVDLGYHVDILHPDQVKAGELQHYAMLVLPCDSVYDLAPDKALEEHIQTWVNTGGTLLHGPSHKLVKRVFQMKEQSVEPDCIAGKERLIPHGWSTVSYPDAEPLALYERLKQPAIGKTAFGNGHVYSFGFEYGYAYSRRTTPPVPHAYGRHEAHPVVLLKDPPAAQIARATAPAKWNGAKGIEAAWFGTNVVIVNHRSVPFSLNQFHYHNAVWQIPSEMNVLMPHSAVLLKSASVPGFDVGL